jgi:hypothetical protein
VMEIYIGNYEIGKCDNIIHSFHPNILIGRNASEVRNVIFVEYLGLSKEDIKFILENGNSKTILVFEIYSTTKGIKLPRNSKKIAVYYGEQQFNPFAFVKELLVEKDRAKLFEYMCSQKIGLYLIVKILASYAIQLTQANRKMVELLDYYLYRVDNEILYAYLAFALKCEASKFYKWRYPKKETTSDE